MSDRDPSATTLDTQEFARLSQLSQLRAIWQEQQSSRAEGGLLAISGFEHQFLLALLKVVRCWKELPEAEQQDLQQSQRVLTEALSDIVEIGVVVTLTQVKRTLSETMLRSALEELWEIFKLASEHIPNLLDHLRFVISGKFEGERSAEEVIQGWGTKSQNKQKPELTNFKSKVSCELVTDPRVELNNELEELCRDEDAGTTIARWLGYLLQLGSGFPPERISSFIWRELANDQGLAAFSATLARLLSQSQKRLHALRGTLGQSIALSRTELSQLQECVFSQNMTLLSGPSGSGKSVLCKLAIQQCFQNFDCLFLNPADVVAFSEPPDVIAGRGLRRLDELLAARIIENPILIIDDLSDVDEQSLNIVLDLIYTSLNLHKYSHIRFVLVSHPSGERRIREKLSERFGTDLSLPVVELPQLPIQALNLTDNLPVGIADLIQRHEEFGPALNLKLLDWLIRSVQEKQVDVAKFKSDLDLLNWFWRDHIGGDRNFNESCRALIRVAEELANRFTPDLPLYFDSSIGSDVLSTLIRKDCLRVVDERVAVSHRFVGDCARFHSLRSNRREIETNNLIERLMNPLWSQPVRWFALQIVMESADHETWQETVCDALKGEHLQLLDSFLDGAILSKQPGAVLGECPSEHLPLIIERFIIRLLAIATTPFHYEADDSQPTPLRTKLAVQEQVIGTPKPQLWEPAWHWLLSQDPEDVIEKSCIIFRAAQAWLNWSTTARSFPLRTEVAKFTLDIAQQVLLPVPDPQARIISGKEFAELIELRQQGVLPPIESSRRKRYSLEEFEANAFSCIVFALQIMPNHSRQLLRALAGREIVPANQLEPTEISPFLSRPGVGVLEPSHPSGPLGEVNCDFRKFMLKQNGFFLNVVILVDPQLGKELFLALTIQPPRYHYESDRDYAWIDDRDLGTAGSNDIDVCTFKFLPLLTLLEIDQEGAIDLINTLCQIATRRHRGIIESLDRRRYELEESSEARPFIDSLQPDNHELTLTFGNINKRFQGERKSLYWHRNFPLSPKIVNCLLMTLEGWLYSLPIRTHLEHSIALILERSDTVAILGVLVTLAKCDFYFLTKELLPLVSSFQLLVWLEYELTDSGQHYTFDAVSARTLSQAEQEELLAFHQLPYRTSDLQQVILHLWMNGWISEETQLQILENWDTHQLALIPEVNYSKALKIRAWFEQSNWQEEEDEEGNQRLRFVGTIPGDAEKDESPLWNFQHLQITVTCRQILDGRREKTLELHDQLVNLLTDEEQINSLRKNLEPEAFNNVIWAAIATILEPPREAISPVLETELKSLAGILAGFPFFIDHSSRCQGYDLDASAFIAHVAPRIIRELETEHATRIATFRCLIGVRNQNTSAFVQSWLKTFGLENPLTQQLINVASQIARLIALTHTLAYANYIRKATGSDGTYIAPGAKDIAAEICNAEDPQIEEAWLSLQSDFGDGKLEPMSLVEAFQWTPEALIQSINEAPNWIWTPLNDEALDWDFLAAALIPILKVKANNEVATLLLSLREQTVCALLRLRENIFLECQRNLQSRGSSNRPTHLYDAQTQLLDAVFDPSSPIFLAQLNHLLSTLKDCNLIDCIVLKNVLEMLIYRFIDKSVAEEDSTLISRTACAVGAYLFEFREQSISELRILGRMDDVWEELIELLSRDSRLVNNVVCADQSLVRFFERFHQVLLYRSQPRRKLYALSRATQYKQLRRVLLKMLVQHSDLIPTHRNTESELLVQLLAELWDCDHNWVTEKQVRLQDLRTLLAQLQQADAIGSGALADQIAYFLAHLH